MREENSNSRDGLPKHLSRQYIASVILALTAVVMMVFIDRSVAAQTSSMDTSQMTVTSCSYSYGSWSECGSTGYQTRSVTDKFPSGCVEVTEPVLKQSCTYIAPVTQTVQAPQCGYTYSDWQTCQSDGRQKRSLLSKTPSGCAEYVKPELDRTCTYMATASSESSSSSSAATPQCAYTYSQWGSCRSTGTQERSLLGKSPSVCEEYAKPVLEQTCTYIETAASTIVTAGTADSVSSITEGSAVTAVTPPFLFSNVQNGMKISGAFEVIGKVEGAERVEYYAVSQGSNTPKYLGIASRASSGTWIYVFDSKSVPNGSFSLMAKIKNAYGTYESGRVGIFIDNGRAAETGSPTTTSSGKSDCTDPNRCSPEKDSDGDGLSDTDELRFRTDPYDPDTDDDGYLDGDEVKNGFNPLKYSPGDKSDKIVFESPKETGEVKDDIYRVERVELVDAGQVTADGRDGGRLKLAGRALPNSFVTLYIYSEPIVLTVKADADGNWSYELDKPLEDGEHRVYVAVTDNTGKITAKSEPVVFVKTAQAVSIIPEARATAAASDVSPLKSRSSKDILFLSTIIIASLALVLAAVGLIRHRSHHRAQTAAFSGVGILRSHADDKPSIGPSDKADQ